MNKVYEQWKRVLASPVLLVSFSILSLLSLYLILSFVLNFIYHLLAVVDYVGGYGFSGINDVVKSIFKMYTRDFFGQFILHSTFPAFETVVFVIAYLVLFWFLGRRLYKMRIAYKDINKGTKGTSRWMQEAEMIRTYHKFDIDSYEYQLDSGGYPVAILPDRRTMLVETDNTNLKVLGTSQAAGKTQLIYYWMLYLNAMAKKPSSMLINDLKGDMLMKWLGSPGVERFDTYALNFNEPTNSMHYNPFAIVWKYLKAGKKDDAEIALQGIAKKLFSRQDNHDEDFVSGASATFTAVALVLADFAQKYNHPEWFTLAGYYDLVLNFNKVVTDGKTEFQPLDLYMKSQPASSSIAKYYMTASSATLKQRQSFYFILSSTLKDFAMSSILELTSQNDLDFEEMAFPKNGQKPILVFITSPYVNNVFEKIQGLFYTQYLESITKAAQRSQNQKLARSNRILLDEVQNSSRIDGLSEAMNVGQQIGLTVALGIQSYAGLEDKYPGKEGKAILNGAPGTMYLISDDYDDAEALSKRLGLSTVINYNRLGDPLDIDKSFTEMEDERRLMISDEAMRVAVNEAIYTNVKKRTDLDGNDVVPNPIYARKKRITKMRNVPGEPKWKKALGFAKQEEETVLQTYMELMPAYQHLFKGQKHAYFDDRGLGSSDVDLRRGIKVDEYGKEIEFDVKEHVVPHELVQLTFNLVINSNDEDYARTKKYSDERKLKKLEKKLRDGSFYNEAAVPKEIVDEVPQDFSEEFYKKPIRTPVPTASPSLSNKPKENSKHVAFSADLVLTEVMSEEYNQIFQYLTAKQAEYFKKNIITLGDLNDEVIISSHVSEKNKRGIEELIFKAYKRAQGGR